MHNQDQFLIGGAAAILFPPTPVPAQILDKGGKHFVSVERGNLLAQRLQRIFSISLTDLINRVKNPLGAQEKQLPLNGREAVTHLADVAQVADGALPWDAPLVTITRDKVGVVEVGIGN